MKKKLLINIIITLSVTVFILSSAIALNTTHILKVFINKSVNQNLSIISNHAQLMDNLLILVEDRLKEKAYSEILEISRSIVPLMENNTLQDADLINLTAKTGIDEIYILDSKAKIQFTTFEPDKGLELTFNRTFTRFLNKIYGTGKLFTHRPTNSSLTGILNSYYYYSPPGADYIIEISYSVRKYIITAFSKKFYDTTFQLFDLTEETESVITDIDIISFNAEKAWSFLNEGVERRDLDKTILNTLPRFESKTVSTDTGYVLYKNIGTTLANPLFQDSIFIIVSYRLDILNEMVKQTALIAAVSSVIVLLFTLLFFTNTINKNLINRIIALSHSISKLPDYEFKNNISIPGNDELNDIADSINNMSGTILEREKDLFRLKNYLNDIINSLTSLVIVIDDADKISLINHAACNIMQIKHDAVIGSDVYKITPELNKYSAKIDSMKKGKVGSVTERTSIAGFSVASLNILPMSYGLKKNIIIKIDDISELAQKDEQLFQAQKMEVIGTLAGGFAHNLNNVLSGVIGSVSLLKHRLKTYNGSDKDFFDETISIISSSAEKAVDMSRELLSISKKKRSQYGRVSLNESISNVIKMCGHIFDTSVTISYTNTADNAYIYGNNSQIEHLLLNLFINAYHSMTIMRDDPYNQGGKVTVILSETLDDTFVRNKISKPSVIRYWEISIADTGVGIPDDIINNIFDPFFSTKTSKGTGLGLATVNSIIQQHEGAIHVTSRVNEGSVFSIYLPAYDSGDYNSVEAPHSANKNLQKGTGKILIIDDEPFVRKTAKTILENAGYEVIAAENGDVGINTYLEVNDIDLILLDMIMPGKSGKETYTELKKINENILVVLSSGFIHDDVLEDLKNMGISGYIKKPYSAVNLAQVIYEILYK